MPSQTGEIFDDSPSKFTLYLRRISGSDTTNGNPVLLDHLYSRPWNWKPENIYAKPIKKLFFPKEHGVSKIQDDEEIDVVSEDEFEKGGSAELPIDLARPRHLMDEFQRLAAYAKPESLEDWEERIDRTWWTSTQSATFTKVLRVLSAERLARLAKIGTNNEPIFRRNSVDTATRRFREILASTGWDVKVTQWLHLLLFDHLPQEYLSIYLDILQSLRTKIPQLVDKVIAAQPTVTGRSGLVTWETLGTVLKRSWDPLALTLNTNKPSKLPGSPILVIVPCKSGLTISSRQHKWMSLLGTLGTVVNVPVHLGQEHSSKMTMMACIEQLVQATRMKIQDVQKNCEGKPIILIGFNSGAALACQVAQLEVVTAVVCVGFPFMTAESKRGTPDDALMDIRCPVMFVIGQNATLVRPDNLESIREKMMVETSLVVVGAADDQLRITTAKKVFSVITQSMVDRAILDEIGDFVGNILLQPHPLPLRSIASNNPATGTSSTSNFDKKPKETDKRQNSTSSSIESEPNSPCTKKSRPNTPVSATPSSNNTPVANSSSAGSKQSAMTPVPQSSVKRKPRVGNHKTNYDSSTPAKSSSQNTSTNNGNGGITLNIGSLASLGPTGPISLAPVQGNNPTATATNQMKVSQTSGPKTVKTIPPVSSTSNPGRIRTVMPVRSSSSKTGQKPSIMDDKMEPRPANQRFSGNANLSALLQSGQSGKSNMVTTSGMPMGKMPVTSNTAISPSVSASTVTTNTKATNFIREDNLDINKEMHQKKTNHPAMPPSKGKQSKANEITEPTQIQRSYTSTSMVVSGRQGALIPKHPKTMTKVTIPSLPKLHVMTTATKQTLESEMPEYDLGNILDIPIIFAKEDEHLGSVDKEVPIFEQDKSLCEKNVPPPAKKVVLISSKQDKRPMVQTVVRQSQGMQNAAHQQQSRDVHKSNPVTIARTNAQPNMKYTKVILSKRNATVAGIRRDEPVVLTKKPRITTSQILSTNGIIRHEPLEIEDAIKTNIIEKKVAPNHETSREVVNSSEYLESKQQTSLEPDQ